MKFVSLKILSRRKKEKKAANDFSNNEKTNGFCTDDGSNTNVYSFIYCLKMNIKYLFSEEYLNERYMYYLLQSFH